MPLFRPFLPTCAGTSPPACAGGHWLSGAALFRLPFRLPLTGIAASALARAGAYTVTRKHTIRLPIDQLPNLWPASLKGVKIGAVLHPASVSATLAHSADILKSHDGALFRLGALFGPQHGYLGQTQDNMIEWSGYTHPQWGIPVHS